MAAPTVNPAWKRVTGAPVLKFEGVGQCHS